MKTGVIYLVTNKINGKVYVGQTENFKQRFSMHNSNAKTGNDNSYFHRSINKYGKDNFQWNIIGEYPEQDLDIQEIYWIKYYQAYKYSTEYDGSKGYNLNIGGGSSRGMKHSEESKLRMSIIGKIRYANTNHSLKGCSPCKGINNGQTDKNVYTFINIKNQETFIGMRFEFTNKYNMDIRHLFSANASKTCKGWKIKK